jgi:hypothetical protein
MNKNVNEGINLHSLKGAKPMNIKKCLAIGKFILTHLNPTATSSALRLLAGHST